MNLRHISTTLHIASLTALLVVALTAPVVAAHVTVKPAEVTTASYQTFTVNVPNEKNIPTTAVKLLIPKSLFNVTPTQKTGWQVIIDTAEGETSAVESITWSGGSIGKGLRDEFSFSAKTSDTTGSLQWKAYQNYADGTVVAWDKTSSEGGSSHASDAPNSGPFSVTEVVDTVSNKSDESEAPQINAKADQALYVSIAAIIVALIAAAIATRKQR